MRLNLRRTILLLSVSLAISVFGLATLLWQLGRTQAADDRFVSSENGSGDQSGLNGEGDAS